MKKHANIAVFVPHIGCKHRCSFCDQNSITGITEPATAKDVDDAVSIAIKTNGYNSSLTEIAFFGGSFTAIDKDYMLDLLKAAGKYVKDGTVSGIRISTRPDAINTEVLSLLKEYGVTAIELGAQSTDNRVLLANRRGHNRKDIFASGKLIKDNGFSLGLQMMTGLYMSDCDTDIKTAEDFIEIGPDTVRIYPTIVLKNTYLSQLFENNSYKPQTLKEAVKLCNVLNSKFRNNGIKVIRLGLHDIDKSAYVAGPWHPAFSELCCGEMYYEKIISSLNEKGNYTIKVAPCEISKVVGQNKCNIERLKEKGFLCKIKGEDGISPENIIITKDV